MTLFLLPARFAAIRGDDTWVSESRGQNAIAGHNLISYVWESARHFAETGRPGVGGIAQGLSSAWVIGDHPQAYRVILVLLTAVAAGLLYRLVVRLGLPRSVALLVTVLLAGAVQMRSYHDAMLGYWGTIQIVLILVLGALVLFHRALETGNRRLVWLSVLVYLPAPLLYESAYTLIPLFAALALFERRGMAALRACLPFVAIAVAFVCLSLYLRATASAIPEGYGVGSSPLAALRTYVLQLFSALPASSLFFQSDAWSFLPLGGEPTTAELAGAAWRGLAVFGLVLALSLRLASGSGARLPAPRELGRLAIVGGLLWTTAGVLLAVSPKYQEEISAGKNHLPALVEVFGWALVAAAALLAVLRVALRRGRLALWLTALGGAGLLGLGAGFTGFTNLRVIGLEVPVERTRSLVERAASDGMFEAVPERGTVIFSSRDLKWHTGWFNQFPVSLEAMLVDRTTRRFDARMVVPGERLDCPAPAAYPAAECARPAGDAVWVRVRARVGGGSVIVATLPARPQLPDQAITRRVRVYARDDGGGAPRPPRLVALTAGGLPWDSDDVQWQRVQGASRDGSAIYEAAVTALRAGTLDDSASRFTFDALGTPGQIVRLFGSSRLLP